MRCSLSVHAGGQLITCCARTAMFHLWEAQSEQCKHAAAVLHCRLQRTVQKNALCERVPGAKAAHLWSSLHAKAWNGSSRTGTTSPGAPCCCDSPSLPTAAAALLPAVPRLATACPACGIAAAPLLSLVRSAASIMGPMGTGWSTSFDTGRGTTCKCLWGWLAPETGPWL